MKTKTVSPHTTGEPLMEVENLVKHFSLGKQTLFARKQIVVKAVAGVSFRIYPGETLGLVGESGCGKSTTGRLMLRLIEPTAGKILYRGEDLVKLSRKALKSLRRDMQIVFQDPYMSLNPKLNVGQIIAEPLEIHGVCRGQEKKRRVTDLLEIVGLDPAVTRRFPHEFSGGQRQRIGIARALALNPKLIICDEAVSALDVSIQAQVINLFKDLQNEFGLSYFFISHDLSVVKHISHRVAVMYLGKIVELVNKKTLYQSARHPYTLALLSAIPVPDPEIRRKRIVLQGELPSPIDPPPGCHFHLRCPFVRDVCRKIEPKLKDIGGSHWVACHFRGQDLPMNPPC